MASSVGDERGAQARGGEAARRLGGWPASRDTAVSSTTLADVVADVPFSDNATALHWQTPDFWTPSWVFLADVPKSEIENSNSTYFKVCRRLPTKCSNGV